jgi:hypothetical protein
MNTSLKPFFYFESLKTWEKVIIGVYIIITICLGIIYISQDGSGKRSILVGYSIGSQLFMIFFLYTSLRNLTSYLIWCIFGLFHLIIFFLIRNDNTLQMGQGNASNCFKYTIVLLVFFQLFRFISLKTQGREFIVPGKGQSMFENKKVSYLDYIISFVYLILWLVIVTISLKKT